jgi:small Trp-rich protein
VNVIFWEISMFLAAIAVIILIMKLAGIGPVATWSWFYVLLPFALLAFWWEYLSKWIGWDKRAAEKKMAEDIKQNQETKKKNRGF